MGYCMEQRDRTFKIKAEKIDSAFNACKKMITPDANYAWVDLTELENATTLKEFIDVWGWEVVETKEGIVDIGFCSEKLGDDRELFDVIAPYVESGSFIEMIGEDGEMWRWVFEDGKCKEITPDIKW